MQGGASLARVAAQIPSFKSSTPLENNWSSDITDIVQTIFSINTFSLNFRALNITDIVVWKALGRDDKQYSIHITRVHYREVPVDLYMQFSNFSIYMAKPNNAKKVFIFFLSSFLFWLTFREYVILVNINASICIVDHELSLHC